VAAYIGIESPIRRCGKTTLMTLLSELVNRPEPASNISSPAFYRAIEELRPTLLIDEADTLLPGNAQLRGILNSGYTLKMAYVLRVTNEPMADETGRRKGRKSRLARYSCFGPKAIAQIGHLPETLADRCIVLRLERKLPTEPCERLRNLDKVAVERLRRQCARFVLDHSAEIARARPELPRSLNDRAADLSEPLLAIADLAGCEWPARAREAVIGLTAHAEENDPMGALLLAIRAVFAAASGERIFSRTLVEGLNRLAHRPWAESRKGKEITERWLAEQLHPLDIRPRSVRLGGTVAKGYVEEDFAEAFKRYIPRGEMDASRAEPAAPAEQNAAGTNDPTDSPPPAPQSGEIKPNTTDGTEDQTGETPDSGAAAA